MTSPPAAGALCIVCHKGPREVPDRDSGSPTKKVCRRCHGERLRDDLRNILTADAIMRRNRR